MTSGSASTDSNLDDFIKEMEAELAGEVMSDPQSGEPAGAGAPTVHATGATNSPGGQAPATKRARFGDAPPVPDASTHPDVAPDPLSLIPPPATAAAATAAAAAAAAAAGPAADTGTCPPHPGYFQEMCIRCGAHRVRPRRDVGEERVGVDQVQFSYVRESLVLSSEAAARLSKEENDRAVKSRKLFLVLDLDHTVLNSTNARDLTPADLEILNGLTLRETERPDGPELYDLKYMAMWTKLRPCVRRFLKRAAERYELYVYTMGDRNYSVEMHRLLDPEKKLLLPGRVIASSDSTRKGEKDLDVVLGRDTTVLILDDTVGVWTRHAANVIQVERYHFFPSSPKGHRSNLPSLLTQGSDEAEDGGQLDSLLDVLASVHEEFFRDAPAGSEAAAAAGRTRDAREILRGVRSTVLSGCHIVFSSVIPVNMGRPEAHLLWKLAVSLGAQCSTETGPSTTHVVAARAGTAKQTWAAARGIPVVNVGWLRSCAALWKRQPEAQFSTIPDGGLAQDGRGDDWAAAALHAVPCVPLPKPKPREQAEPAAPPAAAAQGEAEVGGGAAAAGATGELTAGSTPGRSVTWAENLETTHTVEGAGADGPWAVPVGMSAAVGNAFAAAAAIEGDAPASEEDWERALGLIE